MTEVEKNEDVSPPRLMITKMELENFKSYAGIREIGPFHKCFSAVVGPNGSGKSNVIDAMLFVFGKRAKKLRLNKVSELIHKSDAVKDNPPTFARVSVYFQDIVDTGSGDEDYELVEGTETIVTRIARADNSSSYKIDGKNCQFKDVAKFLDGKGIDLDNNRFLILQGEVEMISMMPPKGKSDGDEGLLEYLEEIIGSSKFVEATNLAAEQVEALTEVRQEKLNRVKAVEKEKDSLESARQEAEALLKKHREIRRKQNILYQIQSMKSAMEIKRCEGQKEEATKKLKQEQERISTTELQIKNLEKNLKEQQREYTKAHNELLRTKEEFAAYERKDIKLREEIKHMKTQEKKLQEKIKQEKRKEDDANSKAIKAEESVPSLEQKIAELTNSKGKVDAKLDALYDQMKQKTQVLRADLEAKTQELAPVIQERAAFQANLDTVTTELQLIEDKTKRAKEKLEKAQDELANLDQTEESIRMELAKSEDELARSRDRIIEAEREESLLADKEVQLSKQYIKVMQQSEERKSSMQSDRSGARNPAIQGILRASKKGGVLSKVGVLGRLGDLATVDPEYDVAVSTACGMLDHIVVQTTAGVQRCLEFLRQHNLGRANFIPLDKMKKGTHDSIAQTPEGAPRLFELISPTNFAVTPAIYLAVGNTLVAPDLETATRWGYDYSKRWRVVTRDGKLIETAGTMTGGGNRLRKGGMRLTNSRTIVESSTDDDTEELDCSKLDQEAEQIERLVQECRSTRKALHDEIRDLKKNTKLLEIKIPKLALEISGFDNNRADLKAFIPQMLSQCELSDEDSAKIADMKKQVEKCKSEMSSCAKLASELESEVASLQKSILDAGGPTMKKQQSLCEKALSDLNAAEKALSTAKVAITTNRKASEKASKAINVACKELEDCTSELSSKIEALSGLENDAIAVKQSYENVLRIETEKRGALEEVSNENDELKKIKSDLKCKEIELIAQIDDIDKVIAEAEKRWKKWENDLDKLRNVVDDDNEYGELGEDDDEEEDEDSTETGVESADEAGLSTSKDDVIPTKLSTTKVKSCLTIFSFQALEKYNIKEVVHDIEILESERSAIAKNANMGAIAEYRKKEADYLARVDELDTVTEQRNEIRKQFEDLRRQRLEMFMEGFGQITLRLKEMYQMITLGGDAELELVDSLDPFSEGIVFSVRPPKKSWKNISNLSGGEKTLSSLALVFALHHFKPTPLYVMDEIDAALDFKNVSIVANYIKERTRNAQFIIISLRNNMFELADRLVGIYKTNNCTKSVTIDPKAFGLHGQQNGFVPSTPALVNRSSSKVVSRSALKPIGSESAIKARVVFEDKSSMIY